MSHASQLEPTMLREDVITHAHFSQLEEAFFEEGVALSARHAEEADELARSGRMVAAPKRSWWRRLFSRRARVAPAALAWE